MAKLKLYLFGGFQASLADKPITTFESSKVRALLVFLAVESRRTHSRSSLAGLLWPDWPQQSAMSNLRYALADLRKNIGDQQTRPPFLLISRKSIQLNKESEVWLDVGEFEQKANRPPSSSLNGQVSTIQDMQSAIDLYQGEFLDGFSLADSPDFEEWVLGKREYYRRQCMQILHELAEIYDQRGEYESGLVYARKQLENEPWHEEAHQQAMRMLALSGQRTSALAQYEACQRLLEKELGVKPSSETTQLYEAIRDDQLSRVSFNWKQEELISPVANRSQKVIRSNTFPTGTITFLFTDIEGSTPLWEQYPDLMADALEIHNVILDQAIESHSGVVIKVVGDSFQSAFATAPQALKAAIAGQQALQAAVWNELGPLKVRMGLHTGEAQLDPKGDEYAVSHTKNRAARIMSAAHGGQILLSQETADLVERTLPSGISLKDLGEHRLKGMALPEHLYQVNAVGLPEDFPPLASSITHPNNLPIQVTSFIGREKEIAAVNRLLSSHRLVTLTGSGGTGKSRLSLEVVGLCLEKYPNGAWLVELAPLADPELIPKTVASALNLPEIPEKTITEALVDYLRAKHLLLILDNCEHLLEACAELADTLIHACPQLTILASSREFLGVEGEIPYRVPPMALPDPKQLLPPEILSEYDSVHLFLERARVVSSDFTITERNAATIVQVITRLDGIPLAIELAASRLSLLGIDQLLQRLNDTFRLLTGGSRSKLPRYQTLRACIDWSYNLLPEAERILLRRLSVFAGGWRLQSAEQVCAYTLEGCQPLCPEDILDLLSELVDKSLIFTVGVTDGLNRFKMLETVRQYAHEKLVDEREAEVLRTRHMAYYLEWVESLEPKIHSHEQIETLNLLELELDNLRLALEWALQTDIEAELRLAYALWWFWHIRSLWSEGIDWLARGRELAQRHPPTFLKDQCRAILYARALTALGFFYKMRITAFYNQRTDSNQAKEYLEESVRIYRGLDLEKNPGNRRDLAWALQTLGSYYGIVTDVAQAKACFQESLRLFRETGDLHGIDEGLQELGFCEVDPLRSLQYHKEQLSVAQASGDTERIAAANSFIGFDCFANGDYSEAFHAFEHSLRQFRKVNNPIMAAWGYLMLGWSKLYIGDLPRANELISQALVSYRDLGVENRVAFSLILKCLPALAEGKYEEAAELIDEALGIYRQTSIREDEESMFIRTRLARLIGETVLARQLADELVNSKDASTNAKMCGLVELGHLELQKRDLKQARASIREGLQIYLRAQDHLSTTDILFDALALLAARQKWMEYAARLFGSRWCRGHAHLLSPDEKAWREADWAAMRFELGEARFDSLFEEGERMSLDQAVKLAQEVCGA